MSKISVVFWTQGGNTESMANAVVEGIKEAGKEGLNPRYFRQKALSFVGIGGSDWAVRCETDHAMS